MSIVAIGVALATSEFAALAIDKAIPEPPMSREFAALAYDNRVSDTGAWPAGLAAPPLIGTSAFHNVSLRVGRLAAQKPFSLHDRMTWLLETLPHARAAHLGQGRRAAGGGAVFDRAGGLDDDCRGGGGRV